jgi:hypothetical protein
MREEENPAMELEITHPDNPKGRVRFRVSQVLCDRKDLLIVTIGDAAINYINRRLTLCRGKKITLADLMKRSGFCRYELHNPQLNPYVRIASRSGQSSSQKLNKAMKNPWKAFHDPELRPFVEPIFTSRRTRDEDQ